MYAEIENIHAMAKIIKEGRQELTRAELEIMQVIWKKGKVLVHDILEEMPEPRPAYNTVSTIVRILESKGFVSHKAYGRTYEYFPRGEGRVHRHLHAHGTGQLLRRVRQPDGQLLLLSAIDFDRRDR